MLTLLETARAPIAAKVAEHIARTGTLKPRAVRLDPVASLFSLETELTQQHQQYGFCQGCQPDSFDWSGL